MPATILRSWMHQILWAMGKVGVCPGMPFSSFDVFHRIWHNLELPSLSSQVPASETLVSPSSGIVNCYHIWHVHLFQAFRHVAFSPDGLAFFSPLKSCTCNAPAWALWLRYNCPFPDLIKCLPFKSVANSGSFFFFFLIYLFYFWLHWVSVAVCGLSLVVASGVTLRCGVRASHCSGFSCCGAQALGTWASIVVAYGLSNCGSWALECRLSSCGTRG